MQTHSLPSESNNLKPHHALPVSALFVSLKKKLKRKRKTTDLINYKHFFDHTVDIACFTTLSGYFLEINPAFKKLLGYSKKNLLDIKFLDFIHPADLQQTVQEMENMSKGINTLKFTNRYRIKNGGYKVIRWNATYSAETEKIFALGRDITEEIKAKEELSFQNEEKDKRAAELVIANEELSYQNVEKEKRAAELIIANMELAILLGEKEKGRNKLKLAFLDLKKSEQFLKHYIEGLEVMMFMISHRLRQPIANLLGIASQLTNAINSPEELKTLVDYMKESAISLDLYTRELSTYIVDLDQKRKENNPL
jgi:PAS domain S-box-containing protein